MSMTTAASRPMYDLAVEWDSLDEELYVSLLGPAAWRQYRAGQRATLLIDLYGQSNDAASLDDNVRATIRAVMAEGGFADVDALAQFVRERAWQLRDKHLQRLVRERQYRYVFLGDITGVPNGDSRLFQLRRLLHVVMDAVYERRGPRKYHSQVTLIWLDLCDIAVGYRNMAGEPS